MKFSSPRNRIAMGLTGAVIAMMCLARIAGYIPDRQSLTMQARTNIAETIALGSSALLVGDDSVALESFLQGVAQRNSDLESIGIRRADGELAVAFGPHQDFWVQRNDEHSSISQMQVPIYRTADEKWGTIELRFTAINGTGIVAIAEAMGVVQMFFIASGCFLLFSFILRLVLKQLDPSKAVPQRVRDALDNLAEGLMIVDTKYNILLANTAFARVLGISAEKLVGTNSLRLSFKADDAIQSQTAPWQVALDEKRPISNSRVKLIDAEGNQLTYLVNCSPLLGHQSKYCGVMVTFDDVTQLEESRIQLREARDAADAANQAKSDFLANMSHEIRTPMNAILGFTDVLRRGMEENPDQRIEYLNTIHTSGNHLIELINDILDLSKVEAGKLELECRDFVLPEMLQQTIDVLSERAEQKGLILDYRVSGSIPEKLNSDATRIKQILINLVGNAIKFTDKGSVQLQCAMENDAVQFDIVDTGIGMTSEQLIKIFDPFSQADSSVTRRFGGTGLGLSICKNFADALGGSISVKSQSGKGSTFTVRLPVTPSENAVWLDHDECAELLRRKSRPESIREPRRLNVATVLVVDDGETNRQLVSVVLHRHGLKILEATNGEEAIAIAAAEHPDLILMDMQMPVMDGYAATAAIRRMGLTLPIIALTGNAMQGDQQKCFAAGCDGFLAKPIAIDRLLDLLGGYLGYSDDRYDSGLDSAPNGIPPGPSPAASPQIDQRTDSYRAVAQRLWCRDTQTEFDPWSSTLPMDDAEFHRIVENFVASLPEKLEAMVEMLRAENLVGLRDKCHWLKGAAGTVGLGRLTAPSRQLERAAADGNAAECRRLLSTILQLAAAIEIETPPVESNQLASPIYS